MKFKEALAIINPFHTKGFMVSFEERKGGVLHSCHFPDKHASEPLIPTEELAWKFAEEFAKATDENIVNIYVVDETFSPVKGYESKKLKSY